MGHDRPKGVWQHKSGDWGIRWTDASGTRRKRLIGGYQQACKAVEYERSKARLERAAPYLIPDPIERTTLRAAFEHVLETSDVSENYLNYMTMVYERAMKEWPGALLSDITPSHIEKFAASRKRQGRAKSTIKKDLAVLQRIWSVAIKNGWAKSNPVAIVRKPKVANRVRFIPTDHDIAKIRTAAKKIGLYAQTMVDLALGTGMRQMEQWSRKKSDVQLANQRIYLGKNKSGEPQWVWLNDDMCILLEYWMEQNKRTKYLVPNRINASHACPRSFYKHTYKPMLIEIGLPHMNWHMLRHWFATKMLESNVHPETIQSVMRHQSYETTKRYLHQVESRSRDAVQAVSLPFAGL